LWPSSLTTWRDWEFIGTVAIPVGISFYTFHQAAFLADAYARERSVVTYLGSLRSLRDRLSGLIRYAAFVMFFPQLVIGPITYFHEFQSQAAGRNFGIARRSNIAPGLALVAIGLFKKVVLADRLGPGADFAFGAAATGEHFSSITAALGMLSYYGQLYFDFSGYSDMALGLGRMFGLRYPLNFFSPLKAVGIIDFYRRWHMTLTRVISRFLYTPLSLVGTRFGMRKRLPKGLLRLIGVWIPLLINFEVIGLWHGAASTFLLFGLIHGLWYVIETEVRASKWFKRWRTRSSPRLRALIGRAIFLPLMVLCFALFRSESVGAYWHLLNQLFAFSIEVSHRDVLFGSVLVPALAVIYLLPNSAELLRLYRPALLTYDNVSYGPHWPGLVWRDTWPWALYLLALVGTYLWYLGAVPPFLYQGF
jgi:D-alanyl-lipoteichoic acid acyltransferase DltB (MBOAT superfamily)